MSTDIYTTPISVPSSHPSLPGHFPDHPLVPGVLMLQWVADAVATWRGRTLAEVVEAKFIAPLLPDEIAQLRLEERGDRIRFDISRDGSCVARGVVRPE